MSVVAEFTIEAEEFLLGQLVASHPSLSIELERVVPATKRVMPYVWGHGDDLDDFEEQLAADQNVKSVDVLDHLGQSALYRIEWDEPAEELISGIAETDATILEAHGEDKWEFSIRFDDYSGLAAFNRYCVEHGIEFHLRRVYAVPDTSSEHSYGLTEPQYEALRAAVTRGYFEVPRRVTFAELADEFDVSQQAVSERVRRGADTVLRQALLREPHHER